MKRYLLVDGNIHTLDALLPTAEAMLIEADQISWIGQSADTRQFHQDDTEWIPLEGRTVIPGMIDAHIHLQKYAISLESVDCETTTLQNCLDRISDKARATEVNAWIVGHGWDQNTWGDYGNLADLDEVSPNHPVYLTAKSLHAAWANSRALKLAKIDHDTKDPQGGYIQRDPQGHPTGILFEEAMNLVSAKIPTPSTEQIASSMRKAQVSLNALGITGVHDFDGRDCFAALQVLTKMDELSIRVVKNIPVAHLSSALDLGLRTGFGDKWIRIGNIKLFMDGALGPRTASMLAPYIEDNENMGISLLDSEYVVDIGIQAAEGGLGLTVHAIGDRANHDVLMAFKEIRNFEGNILGTSLPHRIEHLQLLHPDDLSLPADLGIIASMQPIHAVSDMDMAQRYWGERCRNAYAWASQLEGNAVLYFGSDAPVESPNPFWGLHAAVTRTKRLIATPESWIPEQRIPLREALIAYTSSPAAAFLPTKLGRLVKGNMADLVVLDQDPFSIPPEELPDIKPYATMVGGKWVFEV